MPRIRRDGKKAVNSRDKGARFERAISELLRDHGWDARRGQQFSGGGDSPDVVHSIPNLHIEAKAVENLNLYKAMEQAQKDAKWGDIPSVWHKKNGKEVLVTITAKDFLELMDKIHLGEL